MNEDGVGMDDASATSTAGPVSLSAEQDWQAAAGILFPVIRPAGTVGLHLSTIENPADVAGNVDPILDDGPVDLAVAYTMDAGGFGIIANGDHLAAWGVSAATLRDAAFRNLDGWSATAPWSEDAEEQRRVISSDTGDGWDVSRILLPDVTAYLEKELGGEGRRVLVGLPARHLLVAGSLSPDDLEFAPLFADFVLEYAGDSDEEIDRRVFELREGRLQLFDPTASA
jgi:uncharacterized protein YtpQ (UPF0354 family)